MVVALLGVAACSPGEGSAGDDRPRVVVTTSILGDVVADLVGPDATVEVLIPVGVDPHDFEASARQAADLRDADVVVVNGFGLEANLAVALDSARADGATVVEVADFVEPIPQGASHEHDAPHDDAAHDESHDDDPHDDETGTHDHEGADPHFWHDPVRMAGAVPGLVDVLVAAVPALDTPDLERRAAELIAGLEEVDAEVAGILAAVSEHRRLLVTNHDTFGYFAARYGFEVVGAVIPGGDTHARPSAGELAALVAEIERHDLPAIFAENITGTDLVETLAREIGREVEVVTLYTGSLGEPGSGADTYAGMLRTNARLVADALGG